MEKVMAVLADAQARMNVPKDKNNDFGGYKYRNAEGIIAAFKGLGIEGAALTMGDTVAVVGGQIFLTSKATLTFDGEQVSETGCAMHAITKKGMDAAQISGSASSYARKYALSGLFAIDDSEADPDGKDNQQPPEPEQTPEQARDSMKEYLSNQRTPEEFTNAKSDANFKAAFKVLSKQMQDEVAAHGKSLEAKLGGQQ